MPSLYTADIADIAKPVKKERKSKPKKTDPENVQVPAPAPESETPAEKPKKEKKPPTEKQLAALKKAQETRKRKLQEKVAAPPPVAPVQETTPPPEKPKRKRQKKDTVSVASMDTETRVDVEVEKILKPKRAQKNPSDPPKWFVQYVESVKKEESKHAEIKKPKKVIVEEAGEQAKNSWNDGLVRDRVRNEVDNHMNRMYSMIFGSRRMN